MAFMSKTKYHTLPLEDREIIENLDNSSVEMRDVKIKNPNNPVKLIDGVLLGG